MPCRYVYIIYADLLSDSSQKETIYAYAGDSHTTGKTPEVRNDTHCDFFSETSYLSQFISISSEKEKMA